jgi:hypothetical protein
MELLQHDVCHPSLADVNESNKMVSGRQALSHIAAAEYKLPSVEENFTICIKILMPFVLAIPPLRIYSIETFLHI